MSKIIISYSEPQLAKVALASTKHIDLPLVEFDPNSKNSTHEADYSLHFSAKGLSFVSHNRNHGAIFCDFVSGSHRHRRNFGGGNGQMIAKAVGISGKFIPTVTDLTAGLGSDGFVLASLGCQVQLIERNPIVYLLLKDGLERAQVAGHDDLKLRDIINRMELCEMQSSNYLDSLSKDNLPDIIYMDPMFPIRKKSAQVKKEMQALHQVVGGDEDAAELLEKALNRAKYRVVIKRPMHSDYLGMLKPSYSLEGKSTRYDIFAKQKIPK